jgi:hypothetical protein
MKKEPPSSVYDVVVPTFSDTGKLGSKTVAVLGRCSIKRNLLPSEPEMSKLYIEIF